MCVEGEQYIICLPTVYDCFVVFDFVCMLYVCMFVCSHVSRVHDCVITVTMQQ